MDSTIMWGEVVRAEFQPEDVTDGRIVVCVAVDPEYGVSHRRVAMIDADYYESTLPKSEDVAGILAADIEPMVAVPLELLMALVDDSDCRFDHHGGCQEHGYLSLIPGQKCPQADLKERLTVEGWPGAEGSTD